MRLLAKIALFVGILFVGGFFVFAATLPRADLTDPVALISAKGPYPKAEVGIVALTGGGGARIERALTLFQDGMADRVLISGTHPQVRKADLSNMGDPQIIDCCVDLGTRARTTVGNALEARDWARRHGYQAIFLVTSDFHLPRAKAELRSVAKDIVVIGVPVDNKLVPSHRWYTSGKAWRVLAGEYVKFLIAHVRGLF